MLRWLAPAVLAVVFMLVAALPRGADALPMPASMTGMSGMVQPHCPGCPPPPAHTGTNRGKMPACQVLACAGAVALLPTAALLPGRALRGTVHPRPLAHRWASVRPVPDPFPPRTLVPV